MRSRLKLLMMAMMVMLLTVVQINVNAAEENKIAIIMYRSVQRALPASSG